MKTAFGEIFEENFGSRTEFREPGRSTTDEYAGKYGKPVGWFANSYNPSGWSLHVPTDFELEWLEEHGEKSSNHDIFRAVSFKGNTSFVKIDLPKERYAFFDNHAHVVDGVFKWERPERYRLLIIDIPSE